MRGRCLLLALLLVPACGGAPPPDARLLTLQKQLERDLREERFVVERRSAAGDALLALAPAGLPCFVRGYRSELRTMVELGARILPDANRDPEAYAFATLPPECAHTLVQMATDSALCAEDRLGAMIILAAMDEVAEPERVRTMLERMSREERDENWSAWAQALIGIREQRDGER